MHSPALDIGREGEKVVEGIPGHLGKLGHRRESAEQGEQWDELFGLI